MSSEESKLKEQLEALKIFPDNKLVRELRKQIIEKLEKIKKKRKVQKRKKKKPKRTRSKSLEKYHRYIRLIRDNFPELSYADIRKLFTVRKKGKEVSIPDVVWQNPSP